MAGLTELMNVGSSWDRKVRSSAVLLKSSKIEIGKSVYGKERESEKKYRRKKGNGESVTTKRRNYVLSNMNRRRR